MLWQSTRYIQALNDRRPITVNFYHRVETHGQSIHIANYYSLFPATINESKLYIAVISSANNLYDCLLSLNIPATHSIPRPFEHIYTFFLTGKKRKTASLLPR